MLVPAEFFALPSIAASAEDPVLVGAGDIASCARTQDEITAALVAGIPGTVFTLGDNAYPNGSPQEFLNCYGPSWGAFKDRTMPISGNHDWGTTGAAYGLRARVERISSGANSAWSPIASVSVS